ncbi:MAG TPA: DUF697 domain-containing protein [Gemmataceae bacterium]|nr:DUF697 domain-containing protein [Gemmataceae bacterium]
MSWTTTEAQPPSPMFDRVKHWFSSARRDAELEQRLQELRQRVPAPLFWLLGKTQSGKTTLIKYLTGAEDAEIGQGFRPCTRFSRLYQFPTAEAPLMTFLDTRGLDEPDYDPAEDLARFNFLAHLVIVTVKALDHAQENVLTHLRTIRQAQPHRPVVLVLTCLHEAYPQQQHPPYADVLASIAPPGNDGPAAAPPVENLRRSLAEQRRRFAGLADRVVPVDLTPPGEGFDDAHYGGEHLKQVLLELLPEAYRQTLASLDQATRELQDLYARHAVPHIVAYSMLAATAGAIPIPWLDLLILPGIQTRMIFHLAQYYGQPLSGRRFLELAGTLGLGIMARQATREVLKFIPYVGSVAGSVLAGASTFALGKAFCYYYRAVHQGHVPKPAELRRYYQEQLALAEKAWAKKGPV